MISLLKKASTNSFIVLRAVSISFDRVLLAFEIIPPSIDVLPINNDKYHRQITKTIIGNNADKVKYLIKDCLFLFFSNSYNQQYQCDAYLFSKYHHGTIYANEKIIEYRIKIKVIYFIKR